MSGLSLNANICWPSAEQERLLRACFLSGPDALREFETWRGEVPIDQMDEVSRRLAPILVRRWDGDPLDESFAALGKWIHLAQWSQNRRRISIALSLHKTLSSAGIQCMFLKGMALLSRFCADSGLRVMGDVDFLVHGNEVVKAVEVLTAAKWIAEDNLTSNEIRRQMRVGHAWHFSRGQGEQCDMHWHPLVRCPSPSVAEGFWKGAEWVDLGGNRVLAPCATDQLFHVCAHGLQWSWTPQTRWISDAMTILTSEESIDWQRLQELATAAKMSVRVHAALRYLHERMEAPVPKRALDRLAMHRPVAWERSEYELLQKPCPLGAVDSLRWHITNFRRIRPFDNAWSNKPGWIAFLEYLRIFLRATGARSFVTSLWWVLGTRWRGRGAVSSLTSS